MVFLEAEEERGLAGEKRGSLGAKSVLQIMVPLDSAEGGSIQMTVRKTP